MPLRSSTRNILNPEASEPDKILGQKNRDKVSVKNLEAIALDVQIPGKIAAKPCKRGRPPKNKDEVLMKRRHAKGETKDNKKIEKQITRYESFVD